MAPFPECIFLSGSALRSPLASLDSGGAVEDDRVADGASKGLLVGGAVDESGFGRMAHEAAFEEDGGMLDSSEDTEAGAADSAIGHFHAGFFEMHASAPMNGGGQGNVGRVLAVSCFEDEVRCFEGTAIVGHSDRGEGECFNAPGAVASPLADGIEVDADEDRVGIFIRDIDTLLEGEEFIGVSGHDDLKLQLG
mgnify:CR=1 FL=1